MSGLSIFGQGISLTGDGALMTIAQSAVPVSVTGTLTETTLFSVLIPGGMMGLNGMLRVESSFEYPNNANNKILNIKLGGVTIMTRTRTTAIRDGPLVVLVNRGVANSQYAPYESQVAYTTAAVNPGGTYAIDTSVAQLLTATAQLANVGDTITLQSFFAAISNP